MLTSKVQGALIAGLMFFIISNPMIYKIIDGLIGDTLGRISSPSGCPTTWGLVVHSAVFAAATFYGIGL